MSFLRHCVAYAEASIQRKETRGEDPQSWVAYRDHTAYALEELQRGGLVDWLADDEAENQAPHRDHLRLTASPHRTPMASLGHRERATLLSAMLTPRPLVMVGTRNDAGQTNLAPMTSVAVVSNTPPLLTMSLSQDRHGRQRDTLHNLRSTGEADLYLLLNGPDDATIVDLTAPALPPEESEWDAVPHRLDDHGWPFLERAAGMLRVEVRDEHALPGSVATLVVLEVIEVLLPEDHDGHAPLEVLCQHGHDRLMSSPNGWSHAVDHGPASD